MRIALCVLAVKPKPLLACLALYTYGTDVE